MSSGETITLTHAELEERLADARKKGFNLAMEAMERVWATMRALQLPASPDTDISDMGLKQRVVNMLIRAHLTTLGDLMGLTDQGLHEACLKMFNEADLRHLNHRLEPYRYKIPHAEGFEFPS
jgi:hypothetical protein